MKTNVNNLVFEVIHEAPKTKELTHSAKDDSVRGFVLSLNLEPYYAIRYKLKYVRIHRDNYYTAYFYKI